MIVAAFWVRLTAGTAAFAALAAAVAMSPFGAPRIEAKLADEVKSRLNETGLIFAKAEAHGRVLTLSGVAPDAASRQKAVETISGVAGIAGVISAELTIAEPPPAPKLEAAPENAASTRDQCQSAINRALHGRRITFEPGSATLSAADHTVLDEIAASFGACAGLTIAIEGHTDTAGSVDANQRLSERRARAVESQLRTLTLPVTLTVRAFGEQRPIASNSNAAGRAANRRIDFVIEADDAPSLMESD